MEPYFLIKILNLIINYTNSLFYYTFLLFLFTFIPHLNFLFHLHLLLDQS